MAKAIRQVNYLFTLHVMREHGFLQPENISLEDNFYWMNKLAETLDPYLEVE